ncbi:MAG: ABC transporter ATP-binding protein, partial [Candidatus Promineifilaceae bacterium]
MLEVEDLYVGYYKDLNILQGVNMKAREAEITVVLGANGVGKSTLLKAIYGFIHPQKGRIEVDGEDIVHLSSHQLVHHGVSYIPQRQSIFPYMTVEENMLLGAYTIKDKHQVNQTKDRIYQIFPVLKKKEHSLAQTLSGGEQQMLVIGRSLMSNPKLLILDEPSLGLAPIIVAKVLETLRQINEEGV